MGNNLTIRKADIDFFDIFHQIKSEDINIYWSGHTDKPDYGNLKKWYFNQLENKNRIFFCINYLENDIGYLYYDIDENLKTIELSYAVLSEYAGLGITSKAVNDAIKYSESHKYQNYEIFLYIEKENYSSQKVAKKNGFYKVEKTITKIISDGRKMLMEKYVYTRKKIFIIAEAGVNHNGDINLAKKLIDAAVEAGVDAVKFQTWKTELLVTKDAAQAEYQTENTGIKESQFDMLKRLELSYDDFRELKKYCNDKNIMFMSTPDEFESANFLCELQDIFKIGSGELTNIPYLRHIGKMNKKIILSTGMGTLGEIEKALTTLINSGTKKEDITLLHATTMYPTPMNEVNLIAMNTIKNAFNVNVGYSDHTLGIEVAIAAAAMGAKVVEKHYTLSREMNGPDHKASLEPNELKEMVKAIRNVELAFGNGEKLPQVSEKENLIVVRKTIVASKNIKKGELLNEDNLTVKRLGYGLSSSLWDEVIGLESKYDFKQDDPIRL